MRRLIPVLLAAAAAAWLVVALAVLGTTFLYRQGSAAGPRAGHPAWRRFVTLRFNPAVLALGLAGGARSPWGVLTHVGRASGRVYRTPILPHRVGDLILVPLSYGRGVHWLGNVLAAGGGAIRLHGEVVRVVEPRIIPADDALAMLPESHRTAYRRLAIAEFLALRVLPDAVAA